MASTHLYETILIVRPDIEADAVASVRERVRDFLTGKDAPQVRWESWGKRKMAYPILKHPKAIYLYVLYLSDADISQELSRILRFDEHVLRHLTVRVEADVDKKAFEFDVWAGKLNPLADRKDAGEFDEVPEDDRPPRSRPSGEGGDSAVSAEPSGKTGGADAKSDEVKETKEPEGADVGAETDG